jgi:hypothetical protein
LTYGAFFRFYIPLSLTSIILLGARPIMSAGISRMPNALDSLAVLPVITGLTFLLRSAGVAYSEVVIAYIDRPGATRPLRRFATGMMIATSGGLLLIAVTPLARFWFGTVTGLTPRLVELASNALFFSLLLPALSVAQSWNQGVVSVSILWAGVEIGRFSGIYVGLLSMVIAEGGRTLWLWLRSREARNALCERDRLSATSQSNP